MNSSAKNRLLDIPEADYAELLQVLHRCVPHLEVWAYGSRATFTARPQSDLDLVVLAGKSGWREVQRLREVLDESRLPFAVDCWNWDEVPDSFRKHIVSEKVVVQTPEAMR